MYAWIIVGFLLANGNIQPVFGSYETQELCAAAARTIHEFPNEVAGGQSFAVCVRVIRPNEGRPESKRV